MVKFKFLWKSILSLLAMRIFLEMCILMVMYATNQPYNKYLYEKCINRDGDIYCPSLCYNMLSYEIIDQVVLDFIPLLAISIILTSKAKRAWPRGDSRRDRLASDLSTFLQQPFDQSSFFNTGFYMDSNYTARGKQVPGSVSGRF